MKKTILLQLLMLCLLLPLLAQTRLISGQIHIEGTDTPLAGASIQVEETHETTRSNAEGFYQIAAPAAATLIFSHPGFKTRSLAVGDFNELNVHLTAAALVAIGYGTAEKSSLTGAIASVETAANWPYAQSSPQQQMQGSFAGVQVNTAGSEPGVDAKVVIRGLASMYGASPLYVVDGMPLADYLPYASGADLGLGQTAGRNPLNFINPDDILRIDVLKDAAATAIYGIRGSGGVVLITTRSGSSQKHSVNYNTTISLSRRSNKLELLNREQFLEGIAQFGVDPAFLDEGADTDWQEEISRDALSHRHNLSYTHQHARGHYRASLLYEQQAGVIRQTALEKMSGRLNLQQTLIKNRLKLGAHLTFARLNDQHAPVTSQGNSNGGLMGITYLANPTWPANPDQTFNYGLPNPLAILTHTRDEGATNRQLATAFLDYRILDGLYFKLSGGYDYASSERTIVYAPPLALANGTHENGRGSLQEARTQSNLAEALLRYEKKIGATSIKALAGYGYQQFSQNLVRVNAWGFSATGVEGMASSLHAATATLRNAIDRPYEQFAYSQQEFFYTSQQPQPGLYPLSNAPAVPVLALTEQHSGQKDELQSYFGRVDYNLGEKYFLSAALRADGSTRFAANHRYGYYPAAAFAWRLSEENFIPSCFEELKLRLSYGLSGDQQVPYRAYQRKTQFTDISIDAGGNTNHPGLFTYGSDNENLRAEQSRQANLGLDFTIFRGKLSGSFNLYRKSTHNLLMYMASAQPSTGPATFRNTAAQLINTGQELSLSWQAFETKRFGLQLYGNAARNRNRIAGFGDYSMQYGGLYGQGLSGATVQQLEEGQALHAYYLRIFEGFNEQGFSVYHQDRQENTGKSAQPKLHAGFGARLRYSHWELNTQLYGQFGHYLYNNTANAFFTRGSLASGRNISTDALNSEESPANAPDPSTRFLEKGDFLRLQYLSLGYQLRFKGGFIKGLRLQAAGENLFVHTQYSGTDPEFVGVATTGIEYTIYPRAKTYSLGLRATF